VARRLLALTHLVFWAEAATGMIPSALRGRLAPLAAPLVPALAGSPRLVAGGVRLVSQLNMSYRVQLDAAGKPGGGLIAEVAGQYRPADQYLVGWTRDFFTVLAAPASPPAAAPDLARFRP
jgi:hypothetical protein